MPIFIALTSLALAMLTLAGNAQAQNKTFGAWQVTCAASLCTASASAGPASVRLSRSYNAQQREAEVDVWWAVSFATPDSQDEARIALQIYTGAPMFLSQGYGLRPFGPDGAFYLADEALLVTLIAAMSKASRLAISFNYRYQIEEADKDVKWHEIPLSGLTAALDDIDARQKFPNGVRMADMPDWLKPTVDLGPVPALPEDVRLAHWHSGECPQRTVDKPEEIKVHKDDSHRLSENTALYLIECNLYAYNYDSRGYVVEWADGKVSRISTVAVPGIGKSISASTLIPSASFDPTTRRLHSHAKARGIGDCGTTNTWRHTGYGGFILVQKRFLACPDKFPDGDGEEIPEWPITYRLGLEDVSVLNAR